MFVRNGRKSSPKTEYSADIGELSFVRRFIVVYLGDVPMLAADGPTEAEAYYTGVLQGIALIEKDRTKELSMTLTQQGLGPGEVKS